jgi:hypothetical protein
MAVTELKISPSIEQYELILCLSVHSRSCSGEVGMLCCVKDSRSLVLNPLGGMPPDILDSRTWHPRTLTEICAMICEISDVDYSSRLLTAPAVGLVGPLEHGIFRSRRIFQQINTSNLAGSLLGAILVRLGGPHYRKFPTPRPLLYRADRLFSSARTCRHLSFRFGFRCSRFRMCRQCQTQGVILFWTSMNEATIIDRR